MAYEPLDEFSAPAAQTPELWRIGAVLALMLMAVIALQQLMFVLLALFGGQTAVETMLAAPGDTPGQTFAMLLLQGFYALGLLVALKAIHWRGLYSLIGPPVHAVGDFFRVLFRLAPLLVLLMLLLPDEYSLIRNEAMPAARWLWLLPLTLGAVLVQAGTEELFFRGYLTQQIRAATGPGSWAWMAVPSILFALLHYSSQAGDNAMLFVLWAFAFSLAAADLTARAGNLGPALAFHVVNNAIALLGVALPGAAPGWRSGTCPLPPMPG